MKIGLNLKLLLNISALTTAIALIGCEIPETVTVKSEPNMKLPVGQVDPLKMADDNQGIDFDEFLFADSIEKQLQDSAIDPLTGKTTFKGKVYQYPDTNKTPGYHTGKADGVQSYLITYPIQEMDLDLTGYMKAPERQPAPISLSAGYTGNRSLPPVQLGGMADWVRKVKIAKDAGIILKDAANLQGTITICIPQFWGDTYKTGTIAGNDLVFFTNETDISTPRYLLDNDNSTTYGKTDHIDINYTLNQASPTTRTINVELVLEWTTAIVKPGRGDAPLEGKVESLNFDQILSDLEDTIGKMEIVEVPAFMYVSGLDSGTIDLMCGINQNQAVSLPPVTNSVWFPDFTVQKIQEKQPSFSHASLVNIEKKFDLHNWFNDSEQNLFYKIKADEVKILKGIKTKIHVDLVLILPFLFDVIPPAGEPPYIKDPTAASADAGYGEFITLNLSRNFNSSSGQNLGLGEETKLQNVTLKITDVVNTISGDLYIGFSSNGAVSNYRILQLKEPNEIIMEGDMEKTPYIKVLTKIKEGGYPKKGTFAIKEQPVAVPKDKLSFKLIIEGGLDLYYKADL